MKLPSPRTHGARVYFNQEEIDAIAEYRESLGLSESACLRFLILTGIERQRNPDEEASRLADNVYREMSKPGERTQSPKIIVENRLVSVRSA